MSTPAGGNSQRRLKWGAVALLPDGTTGALPYRIEASADGTHWGNPEAVVTAVQSRLQDGSLAIVDSYNNREAPIHLRVTSDTYDGLGAGEDALVAETQREGYNTLTWTPNQMLAVPTVFDVVYGVLSYGFDEVAEAQLKRRFVATLTCLPFPRSATEIVAAALSPGTNATTGIDPMSSATGWTGAWWFPVRSGAGTGVTPSSGGSTVVLAPAGHWMSVTIAATRTSAAVSLTGTPYVWVDWKYTSATPRSIFAVRGYFNGGSAIGAIASVASPTAGYTRSYFQPGIGSFTTFEFEIRLSEIADDGSPQGVTLEMDQLSKTDTPPAVGTRRQLARTLPVAGSMRTQGRVAIQHETSSLGEVLAYFYQDSSGYTPPLRQWLFSAAGTPDTALVSGASNMLDAMVEYRVPASLVPSGNHHLYAKLKGNSAGVVTLNVAAYTRIGTNDVPGTITFSVTLTVATTWGIFDLGAMVLPPTLLPVGASGTVRITIVDADTSGIDVDLDEAWLFNLDIGSLSHVDCGIAAPAAGGSSKRLWFDPATITSDGQDAIFRGHSTDRSDAFHPADSIKGWTPPMFEPPSMNVFTVTTNALDAAVELRHFPRFLHNARKVA